MRTRVPGMLLILATAGCAAGAPPPAAAPATPVRPAPVVVVEPEAVGPAAPVELVGPPPPPPAARAGAGAVSVLGTPFYVAFKAGVCAASAALAAPVAAVAGVGAGPRAAETLDALGAGLALNCGPPYVLVPTVQPEVVVTPPAVAAPVPEVD